MAVSKFQISECQYHIFFGSEALGRFRLFPKGRRLGATRGAGAAFIVWMKSGNKCLWGDTVNTNIDRYVERYFVPILRNEKIPYKWNKRDKLLEVGEGFTDFRSADRPENWEGFGYDKVFLNEAGIILNNAYLYTNAVLPMMIDSPTSQLIAAGTPKLTKGKGVYFYELWQRWLRKEPDFYGRIYSTYDNPFLTKDQIKSLEKEIPSAERPQEIYGQFMLKGGNLVKMEWFQRYTMPPSSVVKCVQSWDTAQKPDQILNDPSVCTTWVQVNNLHYLIHVYRAWLEYPALKSSVQALAEEYSPDAILIEDKSSGTSLIQDLRTSHLFRFNVVAITPVKDKVTRMSAASLTVEAKRIYIPSAAPWLAEYEKEMVEFPNSVHDDQVDSTSQYIKWATADKGIFIG